MGSGLFLWVKDLIECLKFHNFAIAKRNTKGNPMKRLYALALSAAVAMNIWAQETPQAIDGWYFGIGAGCHSSFLKYSDLDDTLYPDNSHLGSGVLSVYAQRYFGEQKLFSVRPEVAFLNRGGKINHIYSNLDQFYETENIEDIRYSHCAHYIDIRVPLICNFDDVTSTIRPYIFMAPVIGFSTGGNMKLTTATPDHTITGGIAESDNIIDTDSRNMSACYVAATIGAGVNYYFNIGEHRLSVGVEANYECGLSNTLGKDRTLAANNLYVGGTTYAFDREDAIIRGSRSFDGFEIKATIGIPLSMVSSKSRNRKPQAPIYDTPQQEAEYLDGIDYPCNSLDEIISMMAKGQSIEGRKICAIDDAINFEFSKSEITPESYDYLNRLAQVLKRTNSKVNIIGHTDNMGADEFNLNLSKERALSVLNYLVEQGVPRDNLTYDYLGMSMPIATNETEAGRRLNRRVEFEILK